MAGRWIKSDLRVRKKETAKDDMTTHMPGVGDKQIPEQHASPLDDLGGAFPSCTVPIYLHGYPSVRRTVAGELT